VADSGRKVSRPSIESTAEFKSSQDLNRSMISSIATPGLDESRSQAAVLAAASSASSNVFGKLEEILGELQFIKQTISVMDERLTLTEDRVSSILAAQRGFIGVAPPANPVYTMPLPPPTTT
jgi:hypothetical protein